MRRVGLPTGFPEPERARITPVKIPSNRASTATMPWPAWMTPCSERLLSGASHSRALGRYRKLDLG